MHTIEPHTNMVVQSLCLAELHATSVTEPNDPLVLLHGMLEMPGAQHACGWCDNPVSGAKVAQVTLITPIGEAVGRMTPPAESTDTESMAKSAVPEQGDTAGAAPPITDDARVAPWDGRQPYCSYSACGGPAQWPRGRGWKW